MVTRVEPPPEPSETLTDPRELLLGYLDWYRDAVLRKLDGLPEEELRRSRLPSGWTPLALLKHLAGVERRWFRWGFAGERVDDPDVEHGPLQDMPRPGTAFNPSEPHPALIWILFHVLQEYARHAGHLDVARELADGSVGQ
jgi:hypothetical protein